MKTREQRMAELMGGGSDDDSAPLFGDDGSTGGGGSLFGSSVASLVRPSVNVNVNLGKEDPTAAAAAAGEMKHQQPQHQPQHQHQHQHQHQPPAAAPTSYLELAGGAHRRTLPALPYQPPNTSSNPVIASRNSSYGDLGVVADSSADPHDSVVSGLTMYDENQQLLQQQQLQQQQQQQQMMNDPLPPKKQKHAAADHEYLMQDSQSIFSHENDDDLSNNHDFFDNPYTTSSPSQPQQQLPSTVAEITQDEPVETENENEEDKLFVPEREPEPEPAPVVAGWGLGNLFGGGAAAAAAAVVATPAPQEQQQQQQPLKDAPTNSFEEMGMQSMQDFGPKPLAMEQQLDVLTGDNELRDTAAFSPSSTAKLADAPKRPSTSKISNGYGYDSDASDSDNHSQGNNDIDIDMGQNNNNYNDNNNNNDVNKFKLEKLLSSTDRSAAAPSVISNDPSALLGEGMSNIHIQKMMEVEEDDDITASDLDHHSDGESFSEDSEMEEEQVKKESTRFDSMLGSPVFHVPQTNRMKDEKKIAKPTKPTPTEEVSSRQVEFKKILAEKQAAAAAAPELNSERKNDFRAMLVPKFPAPSSRDLVVSDARTDSPGAKVMRTVRPRRQSMKMGRRPGGSNDNDADLDGPLNDLQEERSLEDGNKSDSSSDDDIFSASMALTNFVSSTPASKGWGKMNMSAIGGGSSSGGAKNPFLAAAAGATVEEGDEEEEEGDEAASPTKAGGGLLAVLKASKDATGTNNAGVSEKEEESEETPAGSQEQFKDLWGDDEMSAASEDDLLLQQSASMFDDEKPKELVPDPDFFANLGSKPIIEPEPPKPPKVASLPTTDPVPVPAKPSPFGNLKRVAPSAPAPVIPKMDKPVESSSSSSSSSDEEEEEKVDKKPSVEQEEEKVDKKPSVEQEEEKVDKKSSVEQEEEKVDKKPSVVAAPKEEPPMMTPVLDTESELEASIPEIKEDPPPPDADVAQDKSDDDIVEEK
eukprot:scaffold41412_cov32-Attheya_sp.AAC.1